MQEVTIAVDELREIVQENREEHIQTFEEAKENFRDHVVDELHDKINRAQNAEEIDDIPSYISFDQPEEHTEDYDRVLRMLELTTEDEVTLTRKEFTRYVLDDWGWKDKWESNTVSYTEG